MSLSKPIRVIRSTRLRDRLLRVAAVCALVALGLMTWALVDDSPLAMIVSMSAGQALGTLSLVGWLVVAIADLSTAMRERRWSLPPSRRPPGPPAEP